MAIKFSIPFVLKLFILLVILSGNLSYSISATNDPFPMGYAMQTFGTIIDEHSFSGTLPWIPAIFCGDSIGLGVSFSAVDYYADEGNLSDRDIRQGAVGIWVSKNKILFKSSFTYFNALSIYYERMGIVSVGTSLIPFANISFELKGVSLGVTKSGENNKNLLTGGASVMIPFKYVLASVIYSNIKLADSYNLLANEDSQIKFGVSTISNRFGSQGVYISTTVNKNPLIQLAMGEQINIYKNVALSAGLCSEPFMISFGISVKIGNGDINTAFVHNPILGWSKGIGGDYKIF